MDSRASSLILFDIDYTLFDTHHFKSTNLKEFRLYPEVVSVLETLGGYGELGIFSEGDHGVQKMKLAETMIEKHFHEDHLHISLKKLESLESIFPSYKGREIYVVDDKLTVLEAINKMYPMINTVWIRRGPYAESQKMLPEFAPHATVDNLNELIPIIVRERK